MQEVIRYRRFYYIRLIRGVIIISLGLNYPMRRIKFSGFPEARQWDLYSWELCDGGLYTNNGSDRWIIYTAAHARTGFIPVHIFRSGIMWRKFEIRKASPGWSWTETIYRPPRRRVWLFGSRVPVVLIGEKGSTSSTKPHQRKLNWLKWNRLWLSDRQFSTSGRR